MLISHKYRFIFIKTRKTAGTSLEVDLAKVMADSDVVTPILPAVPGHEPRNYILDPEGEMFGLEHISGIRKPTKCYNHMTARAVRDAVGRTVFDSYHKFCVEREPVSKCISHYSMLKNSPDHSNGSEDLTWDAYVDRGNFPVDHDKYTDETGSLIVDEIIRYETLNDGIAELSRKLGLPVARVDTKAKTGFKISIDPTFEQRAAIYRAFSQSLKHLPYDAPWQTDAAPP